MRKGAVLPPRDIQLLIFLWRWKLATTQNIAKRFFAGKSARAAYIRLWRLEQAGIIESRWTPSGDAHFWFLSEFSFNEIVKPRLPVLSQCGFRSEHWGHDFLVNALHLGELVSGIDNGIHTFSEQELRRLDVEFYPAWVPRSQLHRPDGYTLVANGERSKLIAIEVEISQKRLDAYESLARFYAQDARVDDVLWLVSSKSLGLKIQKRIALGDVSSNSRHSFVLLSDFRELHWQAPVILGKSHGRTINQIHNRHMEGPLKEVSTSNFFDTRKSIEDSRSKRKQNSGKFLN